MNLLNNIHKLQISILYQIRSIIRGTNVFCKTVNHRYTLPPRSSPYKCTIAGFFILISIFGSEAHAIVIFQGISHRIIPLKSIHKECVVNLWIRQLSI